MKLKESLESIDKVNINFHRMNRYKVLLFYKYARVDDPHDLMISQRQICEKLNLYGRIIVASEGINATIEGQSQDVDLYCKELVNDKRFGDVHFKFSTGNGESFTKLSVKVRSEIVSGHLGVENVDPTEITGKYVTAEQLHKWIEEKREFYIVDMRNDFEQEVGMFEGSIKSGMHLFSDLPNVLPKLANLKDKTIVTVCTGGVRCEKASGFLVRNGFSNVYQLFGGIHTYLEKYPNENFKGALYVFDKRVIMHFGEKSKKKIVGRCRVCKKPNENYTNCLDNFCNRHFICCGECLGVGIKCPMGCRDYSKEHPELIFK